MSIIPIDLLLSPYLNVTQSTPTNPTQTNESGVPKFKKYYPVPPPQPSVYLYQNVNHDVNLRKNVTEFFHTKVLKWINMSSKAHRIRPHLSHPYTAQTQLRSLGVGRLH